MCNQYSIKCKCKLINTVENLPVTFFSVHDNSIPGNILFKTKICFSFKYHVEQMVIATCKSIRTLNIVARYVRKVYKIKRSNTDTPVKNEPVPIMHGLKDKAEWLSMDMGK